MTANVLLMPDWVIKGKCSKASIHGNQINQTSTTAKYVNVKCNADYCIQSANEMLRCTHKCRQQQHRKLYEMSRETEIILNHHTHTQFKFSCTTDVSSLSKTYLTCTLFIFIIYYYSD